MADRSRAKTFRDAIHGDIPILPHELIVINTETYQRLHGIRQLDIAHKVYQDAVYTRFEHSIGATHLADRIWNRLRSRPQMDLWARESCPNYKARLAELKSTKGLGGFRNVHLPEDKNDTKANLEVTRHVLRLATLLHDVTHIPFGHMLENQLRLFRTHDSGHRLSEFLSRIVLEVRERFTQLRQEADAYYKADNVYYLLFLLPHAARVLSHLSKYSDEDEKGKNEQQDEFADLSRGKPQGNLPEEFQYTINQLREPGGLGRSEFFLADAIGNTICADLLDYVRRDNYFTGLWDKYDDRIFRAFTLAKIKLKNGDQETEEVRLGMQLIKGRLRSDTISNILRILELRYDLAEKVIFHHARCAAGGMLARAFCLSGLVSKDEHLFYEMGDDEAIRRVESIAPTREAEAGVEPEAVMRLLRSLRGRDFYKPYYRFLRGANEATRSADIARPTVGERLFAEFRDQALPLLLEVEERAGIPRGSVALYCPDPKMMLKETASIVCGDSEDKILTGKSLRDFAGERILYVFVR
jgi:HD superfamily phosphohydrolase